MALIKCPECGKEVSDKAVSCPQCGYTEKGEAADKDTLRWIIAGVIVILVVIVMITLQSNDLLVVQYGGSTFLAVWAILRDVLLTFDLVLILVLGIKKFLQKW